MVSKSEAFLPSCQPLLAPFSMAIAKRSMEQPIYDNNKDKAELA